MRFPITSLIRHASWLGVFLLLIFQQGDYDAAAVNRGLAPYIVRGRQVETHFAAYRARLRIYYDNLTEHLRRAAPDLVAELEPFAALPRGYQVLPRIVPNEPSTGRAVTQVVAYSWPWTDRLIRTELRELARAESELWRSRSADAPSRRLILQRLAANYRAQRQRHQILDAHVQYNRFWQAAIAANRSAYDRATALQFKVLEYQKITGQLELLSTGAPAQTGAALGRGAISANLRRREASLAAHIDQALYRLDTPAFVRMINTSDGWVVRVPLFTDVIDQPFISEVKRIIENAWQVTHNGKTYRVELDVCLISPEALYGAGTRSEAGQPVDLERHLNRFPPDGAILTTGAATTHVRGRAIVLGPHPLTARVLAHEFGHILGFRDRYIRGYKNLGESGFRVLELVTDPQDIMGATDGGRVLPGHFAELIGQKEKARLIPASKFTPKQSTRTET
jgi:hypothetical protein